MSIVKNNSMGTHSFIFKGGWVFLCGAIIHVWNDVCTIPILFREPYFYPILIFDGDNRINNKTKLNKVIFH